MDRSESLMSVTDGGHQTLTVNVKERVSTMHYPQELPLPQVPPTNMVRDTFMSPQPRAASSNILAPRNRVASSRTPYRQSSTDARLQAAELRANLLAGELQQFQQEHRTWAQNAQRHAEAEMSIRLQTQMQRFESVTDEYRAKLVEYRDVGRSEIGQELNHRQALQAQNIQLAADYQIQFGSGMAQHNERQAAAIVTLRSEMMNDVMRQEQSFKFPGCRSSRSRELPSGSKRKTRRDAL